jgi:hypothetical protein
VICAWAKCGKEFEPVVCGMGGRSGSLGMFLDSPELLGAASAYICLKRLHRVA